MRRAPPIILCLIFGAVLYGVPISQGLVEKFVRQDRLTVSSLLDRAPTEANLRAFEKELEESSWVAAGVRPVFQLARYLALRELGEKAVRGVSGWAFYAPELRYLAEPYHPEAAEVPTDERAPAAPSSDPVSTIVDLAAQLRARGIALLVVPVPSKPSIYPDRLVPSLKPGLDLSTGTRRTSRELRRRRVEVLELHDAFLASRARAPALQLYMATDTHWTGDGILIAARAIADRARHLGVAALPSGARYVRERVEVERLGDLPRMTQIPRLEDLFPRERVACYRVQDRKTDKPYEDVPEEAAVLLLGDSFSRIFQTDEPEAAGLIANLAFELQQPLASIVNDGGASTLVRQELARDPSLLRGKRLVIWVFAERDLRFGLGGWPKIKL
jgi:hypothetical protein